MEKWSRASGKAAAVESPLKALRARVSSSDKSEKAEASAVQKRALAVPAASTMAVLHSDTDTPVEETRNYAFSNKELKSSDEIANVAM